MPLDIPEALTAKEELCLRAQSVDKLIFVPRNVYKKPMTDVPREKTKIGPHLFHKHEDEFFIHCGMNGQATILGKVTADGRGVWRLMFDENLHDDALGCLSTDFGQIRTSYSITSVEHISSLTDVQHKFAVENCAMFERLPIEIRERIYEYAIIRDFDVVDYKGVAEGLHRIQRTNIGTSVLLNLQLSCRYLYEDIAIFNYEHHEFYFSEPRSIQSLLDCVEQGPISTVSSRHFGVVILDVRKNSYSHVHPLAWPAFALEGGDWDGHLRILVQHLWYAKSAGKGNQVEVISQWAEAVKRLLQSHTVGKLVIHGASSWPSALFSTSQLVDTLSDFKGQGRITQVCKAGTWPKRGCNKTLEMLKSTIELDAPVERKETKSKAGGHKRKIGLELPVRTKKLKSRAG